MSFVPLTIPTCTKCKGTISTFIFACPTCLNSFHPGCANVFIQRKDCLLCCRDFINKYQFLINALFCSSNIRKRKFNTDNSLAGKKHCAYESSDSGQEILMEANNTSRETSSNSTPVFEGYTTISMDLNSQEGIQQPSQPIHQQTLQQSQQTNHGRQSENISNTVDVDNEDDSSVLAVLRSFRQEHRRDMREIKPAINEIPGIKDNLNDLVVETKSTRNELHNIRKFVSDASSLDLKISGVPLEVTFPPIEVASKVLAALGVAKSENALVNAKEIFPNSESTSSSNVDNSAARYRIIIASLTSPNVRDLFMRIKRYDKKELLASEVFTVNSTDKIYINEVYPKDVYNLLKKVRKAARENGFTAPWVSANNIMVRRNRGENPIIILNEQDLGKLRKVNE